MVYRAVMFDLDGTLLDSVEDLGNCMNAALGRFGYPGHPIAAYKHFIGDGVDNLVRQALPEAEPAETLIAELVAALREEYSQRWAERTRPYPGVPELLDALAARGVKMAILSNKMDDFVRLVVARLLPSWRFEAVMGLRPGGPRKPDPAGALEIAGRLAMPPAEFLYLGDTNTDIATARAAGMYPVGALWGFRPAEELLAAGAAALIEEPVDLLALLD